MTALEKITTFVRSYPGADILRDFQIDYTDQIPNNGGAFPSGLVEISRKTDLMGNVTVTNQYNFGLYYVFFKAPGDGAGAAVNADWIMDFQEWAQERSALGEAPVFGDRPGEERVTAQNGVMYAAESEGTATYMVQLSVQFVKYFPTTDPWYI